MRALLAFPAVLLVVAASACARPAREATLRIDARPLSRDAARGESVAALESGHQSIAVRRTMRVSGPCRRVRAGLLHAGSSLTLRVVAEPDGRRCPDGEAYLAYVARIEELPAGRYDLRIVHAERAAPGPPMVVMEGSVEVSD